MEAHHYPDQDGNIVVRGISKLYVFDIDLPIPQVNPALEGQLRRQWRVLEYGVFEVKHTQADKHLKFHNLVAKYIIETGLTHDIDFTTPEGRNYLMERILGNGYEPGKVYNCGIFVKDLEEELGFGVKATFLKHPNGELSNVMRLYEIFVLYDNDAEEIIQGEKVQSLDEDEVFMFEDFRIRKILGN
ncbi:hypothetical protein POM88_016723 [Heracleum sosnowskyi]|uniref:Uncharacterized protein n=1 Tax=Heracleum sosnowskyi TaxID=360622 RepID=A0AAD8MT91_9APIA|nr:hypothetical protein POM88_016723 [Heracleum sosnowskyi]